MKREKPNWRGLKATAKLFWTMTATSFTGVVLLMVMLTPVDWDGDMTAAIAWQLFLLCATISLAMLLFDKVEGWMDKCHMPHRLQLFVDPLLRCCAVLVIVVLEGAAFGFYAISWDTVAGLLPVVVPVFVVTYVITFTGFYRSQREAEKINENIRKHKNMGQEKTGEPSGENTPS